jgi:folate-binding protein YgfZ
VAEVLRVEAGIPAFPADMDGETIPLEAGLETTAVSFTKGCFPGQEVLVRIRDRGHGRVARRLVGLALEGEDVPIAGALVKADGQDVGDTRSAVFSPALGRPVAMAYVRRDRAEPGQSLTVEVAGTQVAATVTALPFVG